jgi:hypothetical protein
MKIKLKENIEEFQKEIQQYKRIFILATGSSLLKIPIGIFNKLNHECTIGINYSFKVFQPNYIIWGDQIFTEKIQEERFADFPKLIMRNDAYDPNKYNSFEEYKNFVDNAIRYKYDIENYSGHLTSVWILNLLEYYEGKIYLLGYDFYGDHCFNEKDVGFDPNKSWLNNHFQEAMEQHKGFKMKIYNCNPESNLKGYPFKDIKKVL